MAEVGVDMIRLERVAFGDVAPERSSKAFNIAISLENKSLQPILLGITPRFFELADDHGRRAEVLYFCCEARGDFLEPGARRTIQLIYRVLPGWWGKEISAGEVYLRVSGLLPLVRGTWVLPSLATVD